MRLLSVTYDLNTPGQGDAALFARLTALGARRVQFSQWMLRSNMTAEQLLNDLRRFIDVNDRMLVIDISNAPMAWINLEVEIKPTFNVA